MAVAIFFGRQTVLAYLLFCLLAVAYYLFSSLFIADGQKLDLLVVIQESATNKNLIMLALIYGLVVSVLKILFGQNRQPSA